MYTITDAKYHNVLYTGLTVEERKLKQSANRNYLNEPDYATTPQAGKMKLDTTTHDFVFMTWDEVKRYRGEILDASDWRDLPSYAGADQSAWRTYRQELRDLPQTYADVEDIIFPTEP